MFYANAQPQNNNIVYLRMDDATESDNNVPACVASPSGSITATKQLATQVPGAGRILSCISRTGETSVLSSNLRSLQTPTSTSTNTAYRVQTKWAGFSSNTGSNAVLEMGFFAGNLVDVLSNPRVRILSVQLEPGSSARNFVFALKAPNSGVGVSELQVGIQSYSSSSLPSETASIAMLNTIMLPSTQLWWRIQIRLTRVSTSLVTYVLDAYSSTGALTSASGSFSFSPVLSAYSSSQNGDIRLGARANTDAFIDEFWYSKNVALSPSMQFATCLVSGTPSPPPPPSPPPAP